MSVPVTSPPRFAGRVLHAPVEVAGQAAMAAWGLRQIGVDASSFSRPHAFRYEHVPDVVPGPGRVAWARAAWREVRRHDVLHLYFSQSFLPEALGGLDARLARRTGRRVVMEFLGSDVRVPSVEAARNPHYVPFEGEDDAIAATRMRRWSEITGGHAITCDRAMIAYLAPHFPHVHVAPFRIDTQAYAPMPPSADTQVPVIVHAPSHLVGKGTEHVRAAVERLRARGASFEYVEVHGATHAETRAACARADLVVDQLCVGSHGVFAVEAMSMAKPVLCNVVPAVRETFPDGFPMIDATPETLTEVLADWLERPADRAELGRASRSYAERVHDARVVARQLADVYEALPGRGR